MLIIVLLVFTAGDIYAQGCSLCSKTAAGLGDKSAKGLNTGILYLAAFPLAILGSLGYVWWRKNKTEEMGSK